MKIFLHRVNSPDQLLLVRDYNASGYECDIRYHCGQPYLHHDVVKNPPDSACFEALISQSTDLDIILNFKETGCEFQTYMQVVKHAKSALLLDVPFPEFVKFSKLNMGHLLMWRLSEFEKPDISVMEAMGSQWIWLDSFRFYWFMQADLDSYKKSGFKICLVSNELQGRDISENIDTIRELVRLGYIDAVCTKNPLFYDCILKT